MHMYMYIHVHVCACNHKTVFSDEDLMIGSGSSEGDTQASPEGDAQASPPGEQIIHVHVHVHVLYYPCCCGETPVISAVAVSLARAQYYHLPVMAL